MLWPCEWWRWWLQAALRVGNKIFPAHTHTHLNNKRKWSKWVYFRRDHIYSQLLPCEWHRSFYNTSSLTRLGFWISTTRPLLLPFRSSIKLCQKIFEIFFIFKNIAISFHWPGFEKKFFCLVCFFFSNHHLEAINFRLLRIDF